jgi:hypothetical protein
MEAWIWRAGGADLNLKGEINEHRRTHRERRNTKFGIQI